MSHPLVLELPDSAHAVLTRAAAQAGRPPEALAADWLAEAARRRERDPFEAFIGSLELNSPGWADDHDRLLADAIADDHGGESAEPGD